MPTKPLGPCPHPTCPNRTDCPEHGRQVTRRAYDLARGSRYGGVTWQATRYLVLRRDPFCTWGSLPRDRRPSYTCGRPTTTAAHIIPRSEGGDDSPENCRGLCHQHHSVETARLESWHHSR